MLVEISLKVNSKTRFSWTWCINTFSSFYRCSLTMFATAHSVIFGHILWLAMLLQTIMVRKHVSWSISFTNIMWEVTEREKKPRWTKTQLARPWTRRRKVQSYIWISAAHLPGDETVNPADRPAEDVDCVWANTDHQREDHSERATPVIRRRTDHGLKMMTPYWPRGSISLPSRAPTTVQFPLRRRVVL